MIKKKGRKRMHRLRLSVLDLVPVYGEADATEAVKQAEATAQTAERCGYHRYWVSEHHDLPDLACGAPEVMLAHIGAKTNRIRLGTGALLLPHYKPLKVAETFHLLSSLYPGRVDLGIGRAPGGPAHASMALSGNFLENVRRMPALLEDLTQLLQDRYTCEGARVRALPIPPEPPQLWLLGTNEKSAAYAAQFGTGYVFGRFMSETDGKEVLQAYREAFIPSPFRKHPEAIIAVHVICAPTKEEAAALAEQANVPPERHSIVGNPKQAAEQLAALARTYGVNEIMIVTNIPNYEKRRRSYELLAEAVLLPK